MSDSTKFSYIQTNQSTSQSDLMPYIPLKLSRENKLVEVLGLLDSGATVNVLPYRIGLELGVIWEHQPTLFQLSGNLANYESKGLLFNRKTRGF